MIKRIDIFLRVTPENRHKFFSLEEWKKEVDALFRENPARTDLFIYVCGKTLKGFIGTGLFLGETFRIPSRPKRTLMKFAWKWAWFSKYCSYSGCPPVSPEDFVGKENLSRLDLERRSSLVSDGSTPTPGGRREELLVNTKNTLGLDAIVDIAIVKNGLPIILTQGFRQLIPLCFTKNQYRRLMDWRRQLIKEQKCRPDTK